MQPSAPHAYPRRILLAVTGLSPQIVTETLYALAIAADPPFVPTEIHLITTSEGAERARLALLSDKLGWFHRLRHDYALPPIAFDSAHIHVLRDAAGQAMSDIRSPQDNLACADYITEQVRTLTAAPDTALHVSIAGGRKTMGFFLGYALSLFGRPQDRLSHVLVSEPFENTWAFFYPTPYENVIETADKKLADARDARVSLAEIPFVSLRHGLPTALLDGSTGFDAAVAAARASLGPARLELDLGTREVRAAGRSFRLPPAKLAILAVFARRALANEPALPAPPKHVQRSRLGRALPARTARSSSARSPTLSVRRTRAARWHGRQLLLDRGCRRLRSALNKHLGPAASAYRIDDGDRKPHRYRLALGADAVQLVSPGARARLG
jgi:CRISPR-associated protein (TIGR02584 family)